VQRITLAAPGPAASASQPPSRGFSGPSRPRPGFQAAGFPMAAMLDPTPLPGKTKLYELHRHPGLDPGSTNTDFESWRCSVFMEPDFRQDDE
jgi:hypothetical protein